MAGEREQAIQELEALMSEPSDVGPGCYRLDPLYADLRAHPRFETVLSLSERRRVSRAAPVAF